MRDTFALPEDESSEFETYASRPGTMELHLILSITSTNVQEIIFTQPLKSKKRIASDHPKWFQLDSSLCGFADRLECGLRLEVELRAVNTRTCWWNGGVDLKKYLPMFYEKGEAGGGWGRGRNHEGGSNQ